MAGVELNVKTRVRQWTDYEALELQEVFLCHYQPFEPPWPMRRGAPPG